LRGLQAQNAHAFQRCIYIHGTPEEKKIGRPASYGCIRMKSKDVAELYGLVPLGAVVQIIPDRLPKLAKAPNVPGAQPPTAMTAANAQVQQTENQASTTPTAGTLTVEQMRMAGAIAGERQKAKLASNKRL
jgi:L,D-transpeptidase-like protein